MAKSRILHLVMRDRLSNPALERTDESEFALRLSAKR